MDSGAKQWLKYSRRSPMSSSVACQRKQKSVLILLKTSLIQIVWAGFLWLPVLSCSGPAGHVRTWGNCEVWPLFTPGSQPQRTKTLLTANTPLVHDSPFPHCQIEMYFSSIISDSCWEITTKCRVYLWFYFPPAIYCTLNCILKPSIFKEIITNWQYGERENIWMETQELFLFPS